MRRVTFTSLIALSIAIESLTAIVISFGVLAFALVLIHRAYQKVGTDDGAPWKEFTLRGNAR